MFTTSVHNVSCFLGGTEDGCHAAAEPALPAMRAADVLPHLRSRHSLPGLHLSDAAAGLYHSSQSRSDGRCSACCLLPATLPLSSQPVETVRGLLARPMSHRQLHGAASVAGRAVCPPLLPRPGPLVLAARRLPVSLDEDGRSAAAAGRHARSSRLCPAAVLRLRSVSRRGRVALGRWPGRADGRRRHRAARRRLAVLPLSSCCAAAGAVSTR